MTNSQQAIKSFNTWNASLKDRITDFVNLMKHPQNTGGYYYCPTGDRFPFPLLCSTVFASKILYMLNNENEDKNDLSHFILNYLNKEGSIYDKTILNNSFIDRIYQCIRESSFNNLFGIDIIRGETRQSYATLSALNSLPNQIYTEFDIDPDKVNTYITNLTWKYPWTAASNFGHLIFFLKINSIIKKKDFNNNKLINNCFKLINEKYKQLDGTWSSTTNIPIHQKINGTMKMLVAMSTAGIDEFDDSEKVIDLCLNSFNYGNACNHFNITYILCRSTFICPNYRKDEIEEYVLNRINIYKNYWKDNYGGFSFFENKSNQIYMGCKVSEGYNEPDIHATHLFLWGLILIDKILNNTSLYQLPIT